MNLCPEADKDIYSYGKQTQDQSCICQQRRMHVDPGQEVIKEGLNYLLNTLIQSSVSTNINPIKSYQAKRRIICVTLMEIGWKIDTNINP